MPPTKKPRSVIDQQTMTLQELNKRIAHAYRNGYQAAKDEENDNLPGQQEQCVTARTAQTIKTSSELFQEARDADNLEIKKKRLLSEREQLLIQLDATEKALNFLNDNPRFISEYSKLFNY